MSEDVKQYGNKDGAYSGLITAGQPKDLTVAPNLILNEVTQ